MPRGRLNEKHVQKAALNRLGSYYKEKAGVLSVLEEPEAVVRTDSRLGNGRADGLVVTLMTDGSVYTAALEAKSARTLHNIALRYRDKQWLLHAVIAGLLGLLVAGTAGWFIGGSWLLKWILPVVTFFAVAFAYLLVTKEYTRYRLIDVIQQVQRYPANEQWIAISADAYNRLADDLQSALHTDCQKEGIGLLRVRSMSRITLMENPRPRIPPKPLRDFLDCYARSSAIRQRLHTLAKSRE